MWRFLKDLNGYIKSWPPSKLTRYPLTIDGKENIPAEDISTNRLYREADASLEIEPKKL